MTEQVAWPVLVLTATAPQPGGAAPLSLKLTLLPLGAGLTVAVNMTDAPATEGLAEDLSAVEVATAVVVAPEVAGMGRTGVALTSADGVDVPPATSASTVK